MENSINKVFRESLKIFNSKMSNYGPSWLGFSYLGFADQIFIKAHRYKTLVNSQERKISDPPELELYAIINYSILFLIAVDRKVISDIFNSPTAMFEKPTKVAKQKLIELYRYELEKTIELQQRKDHDYGSAWKSLSIAGLADMIFAKVVRMKAMLSAGKSPNDEDDTDGIESTLRDLINYSAFALVLGENEKS